MKPRRVVIATVLISAFLLPALVIAGALDRGPMQQRYNPAAEEMIRIPGVVGMYEQDALAILQQAGVAPEIRYDKRYNEDLEGKEGTVIDQDPGAAGVSMLGSIVTITVYWPSSMGPEPGASESGGQWGEPAGSAPPAYQEPEPQWGAPSQPATGSQPDTGGGWTPPPAPVPQPYVEPVTPVVITPAVPVPTPAIAPQLPAGNVGQAPQGKSPAPVTIKATPVPQTVTPVEPKPAARSKTPVEEQLDSKIPAREDIRDKMQGAGQRLVPSKGTGGSGIQAQPVNPTATPAKPATGSKPTGPGPITATPVQPTATQANQPPAAPAPIVMTPVQPTATQTDQQPSSSSPTSGRVQVKIIKFEAIKDTGDPKKDGKKDEIMIALRGLIYQVSTKSVLSDIKFKSSVYGDIKDHPGRIKAGSGRSTGGIQDGDQVTTNITIFDRVLGPDQSLFLIPTIWEIDDNPAYLDVFFSKSSSEYPPRPPHLKPGSGSFEDRFCSQPWDNPPLTEKIIDIGKAYSRKSAPVGKLTDNYSLPIGAYISAPTPNREKASRGNPKVYIRTYSARGYMFSQDWSNLEKISKVDCSGYGPGTIKLNFTTRAFGGGGVIGIYNMYLRFITTP